jgi:hypothetical protein
VFEAFVEAVSMLVERKVALYGLGRDRASPSDVANGVRQKLWSICDEVRRSRTVVGIADLPQQRLAVPDAPEVPTATSSEEPPAPASASPAESATAGRTSISPTSCARLRGRSRVSRRR